HTIVLHDLTFLHFLSYFDHILFFYFIFLILQLPQRSTIFPYTTLFRSTPQAKANFNTCRESAPSSPNGSSPIGMPTARSHPDRRSEEHTSELRHVSISYAVFCLKKKKLIYKYLA